MFFINKKVLSHYFLFIFSILIFNTGYSFAQDPSISPSSSINQQNSKNGEIQIVLVPRVESTLSSQTAAKIKEIAVQEGDAFQKGQNLIVFDCEVLETEHRKAQAELVAADKTFQTNKRLNQLQSISKLELEISQAEHKGAVAEVDRIQAMLKFCHIKAPFNGRVVELLVNPYESIAESQQLIKILDDTSLKIEMFVPSQWLSWLKLGTKFDLKIEETGKTYPGVIEAIGANIDAVSQSLKVVGTIDGQFDELIAGMGGQAKFNIQQ